MERYRFTIWDDDSFEYVAEWEYVSALAAEAEAIQVAKELSEDDDIWHGGWISVENWRGYEIAKVPIGSRSRTHSPHGQVALMLCESLFHLLVEQGVLSQQQAIEAIEGVAELIDESVEYDSHAVNTRAAAVLIQTIRESFALKG